MIKITVIITAYNGEKIISRTISSILQQEGNGSKFELEVIAVDDCSTDNTVSIIQSFPNVIFFSNDRNSGGPNKGRNIGLKKSTGNYICIIDQDDVWKKNRLLDSLSFLGRVPIITSGYTVQNVANNESYDIVGENSEGYIYYKKNLTFEKKLSKSSSSQNTYLSSIIFSNELKSIYFEECFGVVDFDWILRIFFEKESIEICKPLYTRFVDGNNLSLNEMYRRKDFYYSLFFVEAYEKTYPKLTRLAKLRIHGSRARYYYQIGNMKMARYYFKRSQWNLKTIGYLVTSFVGSKIVKKRFQVFG